MKNTNIKTIDVHTLKRKIEENPQLCLIDVREQDEWQALHIPNALHIPKDRIAACIESQIPNKNQAIYLHCKSGLRSLHAAQYLIDLGYQEVYSVDGGITQWASFAYPIVEAPE